MKTKVRKGYQQNNRLTPKMVYAKFVHGETRSVDELPDPHYHIHVFTMNATFDEVEKEWKALEVGNTVGDRTFYDPPSNHLMAAKLEASGYGIRRTDSHFELASVSREMVEKFSARVIAEIGGDWDKWRSELGARDRESIRSAKYTARQELQTHWQSEVTSEERESLRPECVKSAPSQNLLDVRAAKELAIKPRFEQVSLKRENNVTAP